LNVVEFLQHRGVIGSQQFIQLGAEGGRVDDEVLQLFVAVVVQPFHEGLVIGFRAFSPLLFKDAKETDDGGKGSNWFNSFRSR
jgi:hypothetical protein